MRATLVCLAIVLPGCGEGVTRPDPVLCECFSNAAYEVMRAERNFRERAPCCGKCGGTGRVKSGDGLETVDCPCEPDCECKKKKVGLQR